MLIENIKEVENGIKNFVTVKEDYLFEIVKSNASLVIVMSFLKHLRLRLIVLMSSEPSLVRNSLACDNSSTTPPSKICSKSF